MRSFHKIVNFCGNIGFRISIQFLPSSLQTNGVKKGTLIWCYRDYASFKVDEERKALQDEQSFEKSEYDKYGKVEEFLEKIVLERKSSFSKNGVAYDSKANTDQSRCVSGKVEEFLDLEEECLGVGNGHCQGDIQDAKRVAIEALAGRAFTAFQLRKKLLANGFTPGIIESVLTNFQKRGFINDYLYAEGFALSRWSFSTWGPRRIKQTLLQKGVTDSDVVKAMKYVFEDDGSGESESSMDHLFLQSSKQWLRGQDVPLKKRKSRMTRWLQYRGFNWGVISSILKKLESKYPC